MHITAYNTCTAQSQNEHNDLHLQKALQTQWPYGGGGGGNGGNDFDVNNDRSHSNYIHISIGEIGVRINYVHMKLYSKNDRQKT